MGLEAATKALLDAGRAASLSSGASVSLSGSDPGITYDSIEAAHVGYCFGDSTSGQVLTVHEEMYMILNWWLASAI